MRRPYDLPSLTALACFEAAARKASFKEAAREMNVTPAAVSHQIKALETDLGCSLFVRRSRGVELTEKGAFLFLAIRRGFESISDTVTQIRDRRETVDVTIRTTTAVSSLWLTPKISAFWKIYPAITVSQITSDIPGVSGPCDLSIHYGDPDENGVENSILFRDHIVALGTPTFAAQHRISGVEDLLKVPLIHMSNEENGWTTWTDWLQSLGCAPPKGRGFYVNNYMIALQAAQDDVGAVLGWDGLVKSMMEAGRLVPLVPQSVPSPVPFHMTIHAKATAQSRLFADWLVRAT
ncbi:LysR family transcriptional regulator [Sinorhizobium sp. BG8]|uniref:LysR family transcriptional regulator n=1 Tax=Sinorhizobium sp. BG8 TaxID=2613773 RepID=UPI00193CBFD7|nr:LysR family transcriptional regulator [Sinorhizobium sp. BG8]QRM57898.1 LysR family transcriptional regulator [Sinorhizobium sp. BG8]